MFSGFKRGAWWILGLALWSTSFARGTQSADLFSILDKLVQPVETISLDDSGRQTQTRGSGFVIGELFVTSSRHVADNIQSISYLAGEPLWEGARFPELQLTVLAVPDRLCQALCQTRPLRVGPLPKVGQPVAWMEKSLGRTGLVFAYVDEGDTARGSSSAQSLCSRDHWIQVSQPFRQESLGAAIVNADDGSLIGIGVENRLTHQGSFGLMAPLGCLLSLTSTSDQMAHAGG